MTLMPKKQEQQEQDANVLARISAIPDEIWKKNRQSLMRASVAAMYLVADELGIHPALWLGGFAMNVETTVYCHSM